VRVEPPRYSGAATESRYGRSFRNKRRFSSSSVCFTCVRTLSQSLMRLVMARSAALVASCQLLSLCPASAVSISRAHGP
jgi:hypothetical protein